MGVDLTPKQQKILQYLREYRAAKGLAPTQWEIARRFRLKSLGSVQDYLQALEDKGHLSRTWNGRRALRLNEQGTPAVRILLAGRVAAGRPIEAVEQSEEIEVPASLLRGGENFALEVRGDSMVDDGIHDGDVVIVRKQETAKKGETIVAMMDGEATVKKYYPKRSSIELHPANPSYHTIVVDPEQDFSIAGVVVGLLRKY
jgi:repressor LexA